MEGMILVIGATGLVGGNLVRRLVAAGANVRAASRHPREAAAALPPAVPAVAFDLERPETWVGALDGVTALFLMARPGDDHPETAALPLLDDAWRRGVRRVVDLSAMGAETEDAFGLRKVERALEASGFAWTHLRPNWFLQVLSSGSIAAMIRSTGTLALPLADARVSYLDARELAEAAAAVMTSPGHEGRAYTLTGPEAPDHRAVADSIGAARGTPVRYVPLEEEAAARLLADAGFPPERVARLLGFYRRMRGGLCEPVTEDLERLLGRRPAALSAYAREHASSWMPGTP